MPILGERALEFAHTDFVSYLLEFHNHVKANILQRSLKTVVFTGHADIWVDNMVSSTLEGKTVLDGRRNILSAPVLQVEQFQHLHTSSKG